MPADNFALFDSRLVPRIRGMLSLLGLSVAVDGTNPDLADVREWALLGAGRLPASGGVVAEDSDFSSLPAGDWRKMLDMAEYRFLANCRTNWTEVTTRISQGQVNSSDLRGDLERRLVAMEAMPHVQAAMGINGVTAGEVVLAGLIARDRLAEGMARGWDGPGPWMEEGWCG